MSRTGITTERKEMNSTYIPLLSALGGAIVGALSSIGAIFVQAKVAERRERIRQAVMMAMEDYKVQVQNTAIGDDVYPLSTFLHHHLAILEAVEDKDLTPERLRKIATADEKMVTAVLELDGEWRKKMLEKRGNGRWIDAASRSGAIGGAKAPAL